MTNNEIGSEFIYEGIDYNINNLNKLKSYQLFENGRMAYKYLNDCILKDGFILMPTYSCESMFQYFDLNKVLLYEIDQTLNINWDSVNRLIISNSDIKVFTFVNYFGFLQNQESLDHIKSLKQKGIVIVEDTTHSIFSDILQIGDYGICSFRKWFGVAGLGVIYTEKYEIGYYDNLINDTSFFSVNRDKGFKEKKEYVKNKESSKYYLELFNDAEKFAETCDKVYYPSKKSVELVKYYDYGKMIKKRIDNYTHLVNELRKLPDIKIIKEINDKEVPLFLPIYAKKRDELRKYLIQNKVYCPIHWPRLTMLEDTSNIDKILDNIISIPIDQRYDINDMERIVLLLREFYSGR